jgi:hypothetical protein
LADIIQSQDLKELCSVLVVLSGEAAKTLSGVTMLIYVKLFLLVQNVFFLYKKTMIEFSFLEKLTGTTNIQRHCKSSKRTV